MNDEILELGTRRPVWTLGKVDRIHLETNSNFQTLLPQFLANTARDIKSIKTGRRRGSSAITTTITHYYYYCYCYFNNSSNNNNNRYF